PGGEVAPDILVDGFGAGELAHRLAHVLLILLVRVLALRHAHHSERGWQVGGERQVVQRGDQLAMRQIAAGAEHHQGAGLRDRVGAQAHPQRIGQLVVLGRIRHRQAFFTSWPPNSLRSAAWTLALNDSRWREAIRSSSESVITGAGTFWSMAACTVQRPSPLSST